MGGGWDGAGVDADRGCGACYRGCGRACRENYIGLCIMTKRGISTRQISPATFRIFRRCGGASEA
jgi:hypothetical protein